MFVRHRRASDAQGGFTLVELLVVLVLLGVIGGVVVQSIMTALDSSRRTSARIEALHELEVALQRATRDLRAADPLILSPYGEFGEQVGARVTWGGSSESVTYTLMELADGSQELVQDIVTIDPDTGDEVTQPTRTLVTTVDNGDEPVFRYYADDDTELVCNDTPSACAAVYLGASRISIHLVRDVGQDAPVRAETRVNIRSIRYRSTS